MTKYAALFLICAALGLAGCAKTKKDDITFGGFTFASRAEKVSKEERDHFIVEVRRATQDLNAAREAGRYQATKYCIEQYGTSKIDWVTGPETENIVPVDGMIRMEGYCRP